MLWSILQERVSCISGRKLIALDWLQCLFTKRRRKKRVNKWFIEKKLWFTAVNILCSRFCYFCCLAFGTVESDRNRFDFSWKQIMNEHCCAAKIGSNGWKKNKKIMLKITSTKNYYFLIWKHSVWCSFIQSCALSFICMLKMIRRLITFSISFFTHRQCKCPCDFSLRFKSCAFCHTLLCTKWMIY